MFEYDDENRDNPIGSVLRYHREQRKLELDFIAEQLKIRREYLEAMEQDRFDLLPAGVYRRSFLRVYAEFLKLDADRLLKMLEEEERLKEESESESKPSWLKTKPGGASEETKKDKEKWSSQEVITFIKSLFQTRSRSIWFVFLAVLAVIIVVVVLLFLFKSSTRKGQDASTSSDLSTPESLAVSLNPIDTLMVFWQMVDDSIAKAPEWTLRMEGIQESWMSVYSDGNKLFSANINVKMSLEFKAQSHFVIYLGKEQAVRAWLNGFELKSLPSGTTDLNRGNFKEFISTEMANQMVKASHGEP